MSECHLKFAIALRSHTITFYDVAWDIHETVQRIVMTTEK